MADSPADWMSYADYLGLNEASLRELEDAAAARGASANEAASSALGKAYQQASADVEHGGQGSITGTASYGDFLRAQREAAQASAVQGDGYEGAARASMAAGRQQPQWATQRNAMQGRLDSRRLDINTGRANAAAERSAQQASRDAQAKAFGQAQTAWMGGVDKELASMQPAIDRATGWSQYQSNSPDAPDQMEAEQRRARARAELNYYRPRQASLRQQRVTFGKKG